MSAFTESMIFKFNRAGLHLKKNAPSILTGLGIVGTVASTVMACKATLKLEATLDEAKEEIDLVKEKEEELQEKEYKKELTKSYVKATGKVSSLYLPSAALGVLSIGLIVGAHTVLRSRNVALLAAYTLVEDSFANYREKVKEEYGEDKDREFKYGIKKETVEIDNPDEKSKKKKIKEEIMTVDEDLANKYSVYAKFFDEYNPNWEKTPEYNLIFLRNAQDYANQKLRATGHLFLNEVYDTLDIPRTKEGAIVGWVYDPLDGGRDNYVDFGIYDISHERSHAFVNGYEASILLDFNVDGVIYDLI